MLLADKMCLDYTYGLLNILEFICNHFNSLFLAESNSNVGGKQIENLCRFWNKFDFKCVNSCQNIGRWLKPFEFLVSIFIWMKTAMLTFWKQNPLWKLCHYIVFLWHHHTLFRNKRFALNLMFHRNASQFAIFYV